MREDQVFSARMQIETFAEFLHRHDGALEMPARTARADRRVPRSLAGFGGFPESEIAGAVFVIFVDIDAGAVEHP